jgi:hypothetical protein
MLTRSSLFKAVYRPLSNAKQLKNCLVTSKSIRIRFFIILATLPLQNQLYLFYLSTFITYSHLTLYFTLHSIKILLKKTIYLFFPKFPQHPPTSMAETNSPNTHRTHGSNQVPQHPPTPTAVTKSFATPATTKPQPPASSPPQPPPPAPSPPQPPQNLQKNPNPNP